MIEISGIVGFNIDVGIGSHVIVTTFYRQRFIIVFITLLHHEKVHRIVT